VYVKIFGFIIILFISWLLTGYIRIYALKHEVLDVPNERSSHTAVTPRGGGLAIVLLFLGGTAALTVGGLLPVKFMIALAGGGALIAGVGWLDDQINLSAMLRAAVHLVAAVWALYWLGGMPDLELGFTRLPLHLFGTILAVIIMVWLINLYNFMDGIDGLAGTEAICVSVIGGLFLAGSGHLNLAWACFILALSCAGFLIWNWPPAKIFMGDVGSAFLGYTFAVLAVASENTKAMPLLVWVVLLGVFITDATITLIRRILREERWYEAHRTHAYQYAVQAGFSHKQVTVAVLVLNLGLGIIAKFMLIWPQWLLGIAVVTFGALVWLQVLAVRHFAKSKMPDKRSVSF
jgi:Fuc2NAc and GlcNAc transferase